MLTIYLGAPEIPNDVIDQDRDGSDLIIPDDDGDGFTVDVDCDDTIRIFTHTPRHPMTESISISNGVDLNGRT